MVYRRPILDPVTPFAPTIDQKHLQHQQQQQQQYSIHTYISSCSFHRPLLQAPIERGGRLWRSACVARRTAHWAVVTWMEHEIPFQTGDERQEARKLVE